MDKGKNPDLIGVPTPFLRGGLLDTYRSGVLASPIIRVTVGGTALDFHHSCFPVIPTESGPQVTYSSNGLHGKSSLALILRLGHLIWKS